MAEHERQNGSGMGSKYHWIEHDGGSIGVSQIEISIGSDGMVLWHQMGFCVLILQKW